MDRDTQASEIRVVYPSGAHVFTRTGDDEWVLDLVGPPELGHMPRVTGYHDEDVLRVLTTFCTDSPTGVPADATPLRHYRVDGVLASALVRARSEERARELAQASAWSSRFDADSRVELTEPPEDEGVLHIEGE